MNEQRFVTAKQTFHFSDKTTCEVTLAFYALYLLRTKDKALYERYKKALATLSNKNAEYDELDSLTILYTAYVCANISSEQPILSEEEFVFKCGEDRKAVSDMLSNLISPKKAKASAKPL